MTVFLQIINSCISSLPVIICWLLYRLFGDPVSLPHPIVWFGKAIAAFEHRLNRGRHRKLKGGFTALFLIAAAWAATCLLLLATTQLDSWLALTMQAILVFYCLAGTTLVREVRQVFVVLDQSLEKGRLQVARIVGRDTTQLTDNEVRKAALETLAENLSDGVVAPLFWLCLLGVPGMVMYKMINTLDSMIAYRTARFKDFGCVAAVIDDVANFLPARLTALLMLLVVGRWQLLPFVWRNARNHLSPNSGYPEAALAGVLDCRFGGGHTYFNEYVEKPYIGTRERRLTIADAQVAIRINRRVEVVMILLSAAVVACISRYM